MIMFVGFYQTSVLKTNNELLIRLHLKNAISLGLIRFAPSQTSSLRIRIGLSIFLLNFGQRLVLAMNDAFHSFIHFITLRLHIHITT